MNKKIKGKNIVVLFCIIAIFLLGWGKKQQSIQSAKKIEPIYIGGIVNHHLLAQDIIEKFFREASKFNYDKIVILSPDHFNNCNLYANNFLTEDNASWAISQEDGIQNLLPFVHKTWPNATIVPLIICPRAISLPQDIQNSPDTFIIASVDFSHYLPANLMELHDNKSIDDIIYFDNLNNIDVDCPLCIKFLRDVALKKGAFNILEIGRGNSFAYNRSKDPKSGTSYYSAIFSKEKPNNINNNVNIKNTFLFVGDIMLARGVGDQIDKYGFDHLLENVKGAFRGIDYVVGNLEGPIVKDAPKIPHNSFVFAFPEESANFLRKHLFNVLSLANNHTNNYQGEAGFNQTVDFLKSVGIYTAGHYKDCSDKYIYNNSNNYFIAFNLTFGDNGCSQEILKNIQKIKQTNTESFVILMPHWGEEYKTHSNSFQQKLAHQFIDQGADLIVGTHPHVVQEVEIYKNKLIFYSLGNFIFDQWFSTNTQEGLMVGYDGYNYYLVPVESNKSVLSFMDSDKSKVFLEELAKRSDLGLTKMIENGKIEIAKIINT